MSKVCFALTSPLRCFHYCRELVIKNNSTFVVLPKGIEPWYFESFILEKEKVLSGVEIHKMSSLPRTLLGRVGGFNNLKRVDRVVVSEKFSKEHTRGITRAILNSILEIKQSYFEYEYLKSLLPARNEEYRLFLDIFRRYNEMLSSQDLYDDADFKKMLIELLSAPSCGSIFPPDTVLIFAAFIDFTSSDLLLIEALSKHVDRCFVVAPDVFTHDLDYCRVLTESFVSMGFTIEKVDNNVEGSTKLFELSSASDEAFFVSKNIGAGRASIYTPSKLEQYCSLFKYYMNKDSISVQTSERLDRSKILSLVVSLLTLRGKGYQYRQLWRLLNFIPLWENNNEIILLLSHLNSIGLYPSGVRGWKRLERLKGFKDALKEIFSFIDKVEELIPLKAKPIEFALAAGSLIDFTGLRARLSVVDMFELSTVENLIYRVVESLGSNSNISALDFCNKLLVHAEENYVRDLPYFTPVNIAPLRLITSNTADSVWFIGMSEDSMISHDREDIIFSDSLIMSLRSNGFIKTTSRESRYLMEKIVSASLAGASVTYPSNLGQASIIAGLKNVEKCEVDRQDSFILEGVNSKLFHKETKLDKLRTPTLSTSRLEKYIECPYRYFGSSVLKICDLEHDELSLSTLSEGMILHECLERLLVKKLDGRAIDVTSEIRDIIAKYEAELKINPSPLNEILERKLAIVVSKFLDDEEGFFKQASGIEVFETERQLSCYIDIKDGVIRLSSTGTPDSLLFRARVDRLDIDKNSKSLYVIDYKRSKTPSKSNIEDGRKIQIPLYILVSSLVFPDYRCIGGYYINLLKSKRSGRVVVDGVNETICPSRSKHHSLVFNDKDFSDKVLQLVSKRGYNAIKGLFDGNFSPDPVQRDTCKKCEFKRCCGVIS